MDAPPRPPSVMPLSGGPAPPAESNTEFRLSQCFGDCSPAEEVTDADILSAVQFDSSGEYLATGDRGGRVVIFKQNSPNKQKFFCAELNLVCVAVHAVRLQCMILSRRVVTSYTIGMLLNAACKQHCCCMVAAETAQSLV
eukprot:18997-Heterococcus_DN1.PRE.2